MTQIQKIHKSIDVDKFFTALLEKGLILWHKFKESLQYAKSHPNSHMLSGFWIFCKILNLSSQHLKSISSTY